jgi:hypothetical protein
MAPVTLDGLDCCAIMRDGPTRQACGGPLG